MKKQVMLLITGFLVSVSLYAQDGQGRGNRDPKLQAQRMVENLSEHVSIEPQEKDSLVAVFTDFFQTMHENRASGDREKMRAAMESRDEKVKQILTGEEYQQYQKFMKERRSRMNGRRGGDTSGGR